MKLLIVKFGIVYFIIYEIKEPWAEQNILEIAFEENIL